jgi:hypothetical protein
MDEEMESFSEVNKDIKIEEQKDSIDNSDNSKNHNINNDTYKDNFAILREKDLLNTPVAIVVKGDNEDEENETAAEFAEVGREEYDDAEEEEEEEKKEAVESKEILTGIIREDFGKKKKKKEKRKKKKMKETQSGSAIGLMKKNEEGLISTVQRYDF